MKKRPASKIRLNRAASSKGLEVIEEEKRDSDANKNQEGKLSAVNLEKITLTKPKSQAPAL